MKSFLILSALLLSIFSFTANAEPVRGASYIGLCSKNFPCRDALRVFRGLREGDVKGIGYLANTFGVRCPCLNAFLRTSGVKYVRVHLANGTCFRERGRKCNRLDVFRGESIRSAERKLLKRNKTILARYRAIIERNVALLNDPLVIARYSICLECPISNTARRVLADVASEYIPREQLVDSVLSQRCLSDLICEKHGDSIRFPKGQECIADNDGLGIYEFNYSKLEKSAKNCESIFYWSHGFNLIKYGSKGGFVDPLKRTSRPQKWELQELSNLLRSHY